MLDGDGAWLVRGAAIGAGATVVAILLGTFLVGLLAHDPDPGWGDRQAMTAILLTVVWCIAVATAGALGAWQAAERGAPGRLAATFAGALGPAVLVVLISAWGLGSDTGTPSGIVIEALAEVAAAVARAAALASRLEPGW
jgi:hypothetical protein